MISTSFELEKKVYKPTYKEKATIKLLIEGRKMIFLQNDFTLTIYTDASSQQPAFHLGSFVDAKRTQEIK